MNYKLVPAYGFLPKVKPTVTLTLTRVLIMLLSTAVTAIIISKTVKSLTV